MDDDKYFSHTSEFVNVFPTKIYQIYFREKLMPTSLRNVHNIGTFKSTGSAVICTTGSNLLTVGPFQLFQYGNCVS
jgi:hypothetical protein